MPKIRKQNLPHNVKERLRHQKLQQLLEEVARQIPKPSNERRETKAAKLRRVILYMKFLSKKKAEYVQNSQTKLGSKLLTAVTEAKSENPIEKTRKVSSFSKKDYRKAQIVFLKKSSKSLDKKEVENFTDIKENSVKLLNCCENNGLDENQMNYTVIKRNTYPSATNDIFNQRCDISVPEKSLSPNSQNKNISYDDPPLYMETKEEFLKTTNNYGDHFGEILSTRNNSSIFENTHDTKFASNFDDVSTDWDYQQSKFNDNSCIDFNRIELQTHPKFKEDYSDSYKNDLNSDELTFSNNSHYFPSLGIDVKNTLPPISIFSPYSSELMNIAANNEEEFNKFKLLQIKDPSSKSEIQMQTSSELTRNEFGSLNCATCSSDQNFSENLQSSGESAFITSSNEWLSDDSINDSGNFVKSSCFDSTTDDTVMSIKSLPFQSGIINSECVPNFHSGVYPLGNEQFYELKAFRSSNSRHSSPICKPEINEKSAFFICQLDNDRYHKTNAFQTWNDKNILLPMHILQGPSWQSNNPYSNSERKVKSCTIVSSENEDCCVPEYAYDIDAGNELEEEEIIDVSRFDEVNSCGNLPNFPLKSDHDDSPLPLKENSYSFKNFRQWCSKNCFD